MSRMRSRPGWTALFPIVLFAAALRPSETAAQPTVRVDKFYEDTVRILVLVNEGAQGQSSCNSSTIPVGTLTRDFVVKSVQGVPNVKVLPSVGTQWDEVQAAFPGKLPHVIVHINAGWHSFNGPDVAAVLNTAAAQRIGVVSIGDDAAHFAEQVFGFTNVNNVPPPMGDATQYTAPSTRLWLSLDRKGDTLPAPGVVRNTVDSLGVSRLDFKSYAADGSGQFRCQADADKYTVLPEYLDKLSFLGFQRAFNGADTVGGPRELQTVVAFQDGVRRGVALSFQPQFIKNALAAHQVVYDAILYASFAHQFNLKASLAFTDSSGVPLGTNATWSPENGKLYLTYRDDHRPNLQKELTLVIRNREGLAPSDSEVVRVPVSAVDSGRGVWRFVIDLNEAYKPTPGNGVAETYFLGEVRATVPSHTFDGKLDSNVLTAELRVARPDKAEDVKLADPAKPGASIDRTTGGITVTATDQDFSDLTDTVWARVSCDRSGDVIAKVALIEVSPGVYRSATVAKVEGAAVAGDAVLQCLDSDNLKVVYIDEVYKKQVEDKASWTPQGVTQLRFVSAADTSQVLTVVVDGVTNTFSLKAQFPTPVAGAVDELLVTLTISTPVEDKETIRLIETGPNTGVFVPAAPIPWRYQLAPGASNNGVVEALLQPASGASPEVQLVGSVTSGTSTQTAVLRLVTAFNLATAAYIKDLDGDGSADAAYVVFSRPLDRLPTAAPNTVFWNDGKAGFGNALAPAVSYHPALGNTAVFYDLSASEFPFGRTSVAPGGNPHVALPADNVFGGQKPALADSIGPVIISGTIHPQNPLLLVKGTSTLSVDTLTIVVSEKLSTRTDWDALLRFSASLPDGRCPDYAASLPVEPLGTPRVAADNVTYTVLVGKASKSPANGNCIYLTADGTYADVYANLPPKRGVKLNGDDPAKIINVRAHPPVVGIDAADPKFSLINNDTRTGEEYATVIDAQWKVVWVPPVGYKDGQPYTSPMPEGRNLAEPHHPERTDPETLRPMPPGISTVQVLSTSRYYVRVSIYDNMGHFIRSLEQSFGYYGEMHNNARIATGGWRSYVVWDLKDANGQRAAQGVYIWKMQFTFEDSKQEIRYIRTGNMRNPAIP